MEGKTIDFEEAVDAAKESFETARINNGNTIDDKAGYVRNVIAAANKVTAAEEALADHLEELKQLQQIHKDLAG
jgi:uncharacterized protein Yka (UPF0111/DUF47 family)